MASQRTRVGGPRTSHSLARPLLHTAPRMTPVTLNQQAQPIKSIPHAAKLHCPHLGGSGDTVFDILLGTAMQAQQVSSCYNNCLATSVSVVKAAEMLGAPGYKLVFGHLASTRSEVTQQVPHVWVEWQDRLILDATLSDVVSTEEQMNIKSKLEFVPGRAARPMADVGLPDEAKDQDKLEQFVNNPDEYVALLSGAAPSTPQAAAYLLYISLTQGLAGAKDDIQQLIAASA